MTSDRVRWLLAPAVLLLAGFVCLGQAAEEEPNPFIPSDSQNTPGRSVKPKTPAGEKAAVPGREKLLKTIEHGLGRMKVPAPHKKSLDDYWVIGTAELNLADRHADIRFDAKQGQRETAEFLVDYVLGAPQETRRQWHVFDRFKTADEAEQFLQSCRQQYDAATAYRQQIAQIYQARTTRRC